MGYLRAKFLSRKMGWIELMRPDPDRRLVAVKETVQQRANALAA